MNVPFFKNFQPDLLIHSWLTEPWTYPLAFVFFFGFLILVLVGCRQLRESDRRPGRAGDRADGHRRARHDRACRIFPATPISRAIWTFRARPGACELTIFCGAMFGASLGFLWYNAHPAEIFMGDVGSLALGGGLGTVAVLLKQEILLLFIGGVFVIEALSVILQVGSFKLRGKRIFKMAPLHHHFEQLGWEESKIIARFWIAGLVLALFALTTLKLR